MKNIAAEFEPLAQAFNSMAEQLADRDRSLRAANNRLTVLAMIDTVSGLSNRRAFESRMEFEWLRASEESQSLGLIMVDVDYFKLYNDTYGHQAGDDCLAQVAQVLKKSVRTPHDVVSRYGGEEFVVILFDCPENMAEQVALRIQEELHSAAIPHSGSKISGVVTASMGIAGMEDGLAGPEIIARADAALYRAKEAGRDRWSR